MSTLADSLAVYWSSIDRPNTLRSYRGNWERWVAWLEGRALSPLEVKPLEVKEYLASMAKQSAKATRSRALTTIRSVYGALVVDGLLVANPAREVKNPKVGAAPRTPWIDDEAAFKLVEGMPCGTWREARDRLCVLIMLFMGLRRWEVAKLRVEEFSKDGTRLKTEVKGGKVETFGVPATLAAEIAAWRARADITDGALLPRSPEDRRPISPRMVYDIVRNAGTRVDVAIAPHGLRRSFITILRRRGTDIRDLQRAVGHESLTTTERYDHDGSVNAPGEDMAEVLGLDRKKD
ncbi:MAG: tyrosine-type recombinase/integrase [Myxococcota bacterium]